AARRGRLPASTATAASTRRVVVGVTAVVVATAAAAATAPALAALVALADALLELLRKDGLLQQLNVQLLLLLDALRGHGVGPIVGPPVPGRHLGVSDS